MTAFLIVATLMVVAALLFILPTLLRKERNGVIHTQRDALNLAVLRDQLKELDADRASGIIDESGYQSSRAELERRVAEDVKPAIPVSTAKTGNPWLAYVVGIILPVIAVALYLTLGKPGGLDPVQVAATPSAKDITPEQVAAMVDKLEQHLKQEPSDAKGWAMLARATGALGRFSEAADAYAHLSKLLPPDAELLADYADALGMAQNRSLQGEPEKLIAQALVLDPKNIKALALAGGVAFERHDYATAIGQWKAIQALVPADSDMGRSVASSLEEAQKLAAGTPDAPAASTQVASANAGTAASAPVSTAAQVSGVVELDAGLRSQVKDSDTVFIFARAVDGPRFPLAVLRKQVKDLPIGFTLDDSMSMMPGAKLSGFPLVVVGARISKSGSATPEAGDLEGLSSPVKPGTANLHIKIDAPHK